MCIRDRYEGFWNCNGLITKNMSFDEEEEEMLFSLDDQCFDSHVETNRMPLGSIGNLQAQNNSTRCRSKQSEATRLAKRNARERNRVLLVNKEFQRLRSIIKNSEFLRGARLDFLCDEDSSCDVEPSRRGKSGRDELASKKLSKVNTLKTAIRYIKYLSKCLRQDQTDFDFDIDELDLTDSSLDLPSSDGSFGLSNNSSITSSASPAQEGVCFQPYCLSNQAELLTRSSFKQDENDAGMYSPESDCYQHQLDLFNLGYEKSSSFNLFHHYY